MKFMNKIHFLIIEQANKYYSKIEFHSYELFPSEPMLRVLESPGLSVQIKMKKSNLSFTIGPFNMKDYI